MTQKQLRIGELFLKFVSRYYYQRGSGTWVAPQPEALAALCETIARAFTALTANHFYQSALAKILDAEEDTKWTIEQTIHLKDWRELLDCMFISAGLEEGPDEAAAVSDFLENWPKIREQLTAPQTESTACRHGQFGPCWKCKRNAYRRERNARLKEEAARLSAGPSGARSSS